jgi:hypothetical protein
MDPSYNNSFDSFGANSGRLDGGVVLSGAQPQKNKKKTWLILVVALFIIGIIIAIVLLVTSKSKSGTNFSEVQKFTNYVVNGDENNGSSISLLDSYGEMYYYEKAFYSDNAEEFTNISLKIDEYLNNINNNGSIGDNKKDDIAYIGTLVNVLRIQFQLNQMSFDAMVKEASNGDSVKLGEILKEVDSLDGFLGLLVSKYKTDANGALVAINILGSYCSKLQCDLESQDFSSCFDAAAERGEDEEMLETVIAQKVEYAERTRSMSDTIDEILSELVYSLNGLSESEDGSDA